MEQEEAPKSLKVCTKESVKFSLEMTKIKYTECYLTKIK